MSAYSTPPLRVRRAIAVMAFIALGCAGFFSLAMAVLILRIWESL